MEQELSSRERASQWIVIFITLLVAAALWAGLAVWLHVYEARNESSEGSGLDILAKLGTFYGGFVGTIVSALALGVLVWTVRVQLRELTYTRREFRAARIAQEEANQIRRHELAIQALEFAPELLSVTIETGGKWANDDDDYLIELDGTLELPAIYDALGRHLASPTRSNLYGRDYRRDKQGSGVQYRFRIPRLMRADLVLSNRLAAFLFVGRTRMSELVVYRCVVIFSSRSERIIAPCLASDLLPEVEENLTSHIKNREAESDYLGDFR